MKDTIHYCWLGGLALPYTAEFPQNVERFPSPDNGVTPTAIPPVCVSEKDWEFYHSQGIERKADMEFSVLAAHFSDSLLPFDRVIIHSVALRRQDKAYLICAASGTGKTTQARFLQQLHPGEFGIICGDRPVLEFREKEIVVHPSPWNGKRICTVRKQPAWPASFFWSEAMKTVSFLSRNGKRPFHCIRSLYRQVWNRRTYGALCSLR